MPFKLIIILLILKFIQVQPGDNCDSLRKCQDCIHAPSCGWYLQYRSANGSGCFDNDYLEQHKTDTVNGYSFPPRASFHIVKNEKSNPISPQEVSLNLRLNDPFTFPITLTPGPQWLHKSIELRHNLKKQQVVKLTFFTNCGNRKITESDKCDNIELGKPVTFWVKVEQKQCSKRQPEQIKRIKIYLTPGDAVFRLHLYAYCYCPCEMDDAVSNPKVVPQCRKRGSFECGVCYCNDGFAGKNCEINTSNTLSGKPYKN
ncbi:integrin beta-PS-like [Tribolium madens]|uniref:integrin beta-PS-like n=1 Tax=Tribolium madens TaxID=41895 RepID=UPI001CF738C9|nr:integrin beta-PS-like [Tribolium madens]